MFSPLLMSTSVISRSTIFHLNTWHLSFSLACSLYFFSSPATFSFLLNRRVEWEWERHVKWTCILDLGIQVNCDEEAEAAVFRDACIFLKERSEQEKKRRKCSRSREWTAFAKMCEQGWGKAIEDEDTRRGQLMRINGQRERERESRRGEVNFLHASGQVDLVPRWTEWPLSQVAWWFSEYSIIFSPATQY